MSLRGLLNQGLYGLGTLLVCVAVYALLRGLGGAWQAWRAGNKHESFGLILALVQVAIFLAALLVLMQTNGRGSLLLSWLMVALPASGVAASVYRHRMCGARENPAASSVSHHPTRLSGQTLGKQGREDHHSG